MARNARASSLLWPWRIVKFSRWEGAEMADRGRAKHWVVDRIVHSAADCARPLPSLSTRIIPLE